MSGKYTISKRVLIAVLVFAAFYLAINYRWVRAASAAAISNSCEEKLLKKARHAVETLFGTVQSQPIVACMDGPVLGLQVSHGLTNFAPGLPSVILIGSHGAEENVAAHEWAHAEFAQRVGVIQRQMHVPTWFDEGLAMQVDFRADYNLEALRAFRSRKDLRLPQLDDIAAAEFFRADGQGKLHYALSRCIVGEWLTDNPDWTDRVERIGFFSRFPVDEFRGLCSKRETP